MNNPATMPLVPRTAAWTTKNVLPLPGTVSFSPDLQEAFDELHALRLLEEDWDAHDAPPIAPQAIAAAQVLIERSAQEAYQQNIKWQVPDIAPTPDGGVYLHWSGKGGAYSAIMPPHPEAIILLIGKRGHRAERQLLAPDAAVEAVVQLMAAQPQSA